VDRLGRPAVQVLGAGAAIALGWSSTAGLPLVWAGPYALSALAGLWWLARVLPSGRGPALAEAREFWAYTAPRALGSVAQVALQRLDIVLVAALAGPVQAAVYTAATRFVVLGQLAAQAIATGVQHRFGTLFAVGDRAAAGELYRTATGWLIALTWPVYLLLAVLAPYLLPVFGPGYGVGAPMLVILALAMLVATGTGMVDNVLNMAGRTTWTLANVVLALVVDVVLNVVLVPRIGALGAAIAWAVAIVLNNLLPLGQLAVSLRLHPFGAGAATAAGLAVGCFGVLPFVAAELGGRSPAVLLGATVAGGLFYVAGLWVARGPLRLLAWRAG
jgi:O-antigen/teichoic acid export membrane protein